jgi:hypothetical protein
MTLRWKTFVIFVVLNLGIIASSMIINCSAELAIHELNIVRQRLKNLKQQGDNKQ